MCARVHVRARLRVRPRVRACARLPACPPARPPACPPAIASVVWLAQNHQQSLGSWLSRWMTADGMMEGVAGLFRAK